MLGEFTNPFKLKSQNSLAEGSVHGVHCLLGNHKRAFPCRSNPINCLPSTCSESVEPDGEECVLSRCSTGNLSALKGRCLLEEVAHWSEGRPISGDLHLPLRALLVKPKREELEIRSPATSGPTLISSDLSLVRPWHPRAPVLLYGGIQTNLLFFLSAKVPSRKSLSNAP